MASFTDRDRDGDMDLIVAGDRSSAGGPGPTNFYRNDGPGDDGFPIFIDDAPEVSFAPWVHGMGVDSFDFNGDGLLDYCISDAVPALGCDLSGPQGYVDAGLELRHPDAG
jgi:hypothetical protein